MAVERKTLFPEHLENAAVFIIDTDPKSRYFKITDLPDTFTGGKNSFSIQGSKQLVPNSLIHIEVKDAQGIRIYHEVADGGNIDYYEGVSKPVSVHIYDDTAFGECTITLIGEISQYEINGVMYDIPDNWRGRPNVKWQAKVNVYPFLTNTTKIRFYKRPKVSLEERTLFLYKRNITLYTTTGYCRGFVGPNVTSGQNYSDDYYYTIESISPSSASIATGSYLNQLYGGTSPYLNTTISASKFTTSKLVNRYLELNNIVSSEGYPAIGPRFWRPAYPGQPPPKSMYTKWRSKIKSLLSNNSVLATGFGLGYFYAYNQPINSSLNGYIEAGGPDNDAQWYQKTENPWYSGLYINDFAYAEYTASWEEEQYIPSNVSTSYAYVKFTDLETFSGDVYRVKVYAKSKNDLQGYTLLEDLSLEGQELLQRRVFYNEPYYNSGFFTNTANIAELWSWSYADPAYSDGIQVPYIDNDSTNLFLQNSAVLTPANDIPLDKSIGIYRFWNTDLMDFVETSDYKVTLKPLVESYGTSSLALSRANAIDIYMSGSSFASGTQDFYIENSEYGKKIGEIETLENVKRFDTQEFTFSPLRTGTGQIQFIVRNGKWKLSEISITPLRETAISPPEYSFYTYPEISIPSQSFDFRFEFFDINYNYVPIKLEKSITFSGVNVLDPTIQAVVYRDFETIPYNRFNLDLSGNVDREFLWVKITATGTTSNVILISGSAQSEAHFSGSFGPNSVGDPIPTNYPTIVYPGKLTFSSTDGISTYYQLFWSDFTGSFASPAEVYDVNYIAQLEDNPSVFTTFRVYRQRNVPATTTTTTTTSTTTSTTTIPITGDAFLAIRNSYLVPEYSSLQSECGGIGGGCDCYKNNISPSVYRGDHKIVNVVVGGIQVSSSYPGNSPISYPRYSDTNYNVLDVGGACALDWSATTSPVWTSGSIGTTSNIRSVVVTIYKNTTANLFHASDITTGHIRLSNIEGANLVSSNGSSWANYIEYPVPDGPGNQTFTFYTKQLGNQKNFALQFYEATGTPTTFGAGLNLGGGGNGFLVDDGSNPQTPIP